MSSNRSLTWGPVFAALSLTLWGHPRAWGADDGAHPRVTAAPGLAEQYAAATRSADDSAIAGVALSFDEEILRSRGIDPSLAAYFARQPRFAPGEQLVDVVLNGRSLGRHLALFGSNGGLCATPRWVESMGLRSAANGNGAAPSACPTIESAVSERAVLRLSVASQSIDITVPEEVVAAVKAPSGYTGGGTGALLNYDLYQSTVEFSGVSHFRFLFADTTAGVNVDDWMLRVRSRYSGSNGRGATTHVGWVQRTFERERQLLQAGQVVTRDPLFGGAPLVGAQWLPEDALRYSGTLYPITGTAATRARVEIRQAGLLIYTVTVPPGPFSITDYGQVSGISDLQVRVIEEAGTEHEFTVAGNAVVQHRTAVSEGGLWLAVGTLDDANGGTRYRNDVVVSAAYGWRLGHVNLLGGVVQSSDFTSVAASASAGLLDMGIVFGGEAYASADGRAHRQGNLVRLSAQQRLDEHFSWGVSANARTKGFRQLTDALSSENSTALGATGAKSQVSLNGNYSTEWIGGVSLSYTRQENFDGGSGTAFSVGWTRALPLGASISLSAVRNLDRTLATGPGVGVSPTDAATAGSTSVHLGVTIPLGAKANARAYSGRLNGVSRYGVRGQYAAADWFSFVGGYEDGETIEPSSDVSVNVVPRYTSLGLGVSHASTHDGHFTRLSGGIAAAQGTVALSPHAIQDSFALVDTGGIGGMRLDSPQGAVWSMPNGYAVIPSLPPYRPSVIEVAGSSVDTDVEIGAGKFEIMATRGAVATLDTRSVKVKRILLSLVDVRGDAISTGLAVLDGEGNYVGATGKGGRALITSRGDHPQAFFVTLPEGRRCAISEAVVKPRADDDLLEQGSAQCL